MERGNIEKYDPVKPEDLRKRELFDLLADAQKKAELEKIMAKAQMENCDSFYTLAAKEDNQENKEALLLAIKVAERVKELGGVAMVAGGYTRDAVMAKLGMGKSPKDIDLEIYGVELGVLESELSNLGSVNKVGQSFGVLKIGELDIAIPRRDSKTGDGHRGFEVEGDPNMLMVDASRRRDFTMNAMLLNPLTGEVIDYYGGIDDIREKTIKIVDPETFGDDPLRVLRAAQFAGRFDFSIDLETVKICRGMDVTQLPKERIGEEWLKMLLKSDRPSVGLEAMRWLGVLEKLHPELVALVGVPQNPEHHPEGDVWTHTKMVVDTAAEICRRENLDQVAAKTLMLAALCHDLGKPEKTTTDEDGRIISHDHDDAGVEPTKRLLGNLNIPKDLITRVAALVKNHMQPLMMKEVTDRGVRRLADKLSPATIMEVVLLTEADLMGLTRHPFLGAEILKKADELAIKESKPQPIISGKMLIELGLKPGLEMGQALKKLFQWQLDGKFVDVEGGMKYAHLAKFATESLRKNIAPESLLNGEQLTKEDMIGYVEQRLADEGVQDMGTLVMTMILMGRDLPPILERNKKAILTAHKYGPIWFSHLDREFYETSWKSFYGQFEAGGDATMAPLRELPYDKQLDRGLGLILHPDSESIDIYKKSLDINPVESSGVFALYETDEYPFGSGMLSGFRIMVQFNPIKKRLSVSVLNESTDRVAEIDREIRALIPDLAEARKVGYLTMDYKADGTSFGMVDAREVYVKLLNHLKID